MLALPLGPAAGAGGPGRLDQQGHERTLAEYAGIVYEALSDNVGFWITLNEPWVSAWMGYGLGVHAPGHKDSARALAATHHLLLGHGLAMERMRSAGDENQLGVTVNLHPAHPSRDREVR